MINTDFSAKVFIASTSCSNNCQKKKTRILAKNGMKLVGAVTSADRGSLVTMAVAVSPSGNSISPFFVFRPKKCRNYFIAWGPDDSAGSPHN